MALTQRPKYLLVYKIEEESSKTDGRRREEKKRREGKEEEEEEKRIEEERKIKKVWILVWISMIFGMEL